MSFQTNNICTHALARFYLVNITLFYICSECELNSKVQYDLSKLQIF